ncbi:MAG: polyphenol oxidase family protein [Actinomycetota bacterium]|nr:polyphenol oxidase family protein [Actinomycetota bacterium]
MSKPRVTRHSLPGGVHVRWTSRADGDQAGRGADADARRQRVAAGPWTLLRQVHGAKVVEVDMPGARSGEDADAAVTAHPGVVLAVLTADCAPIVLGSEEGVIGVAHAGWRGLVAGVVDATATAMRSLGATRISALVGPCIHPQCYPFGVAELDRVAGLLGPAVRSTDRLGNPALDLPAAVRLALDGSGVVLADDIGPCTACRPDLWSWRARQDRQRHAAVAWR